MKFGTKLAPACLQSFIWVILIRHQFAPADSCGEYYSFPLVHVIIFEFQLSSLHSIELHFQDAIIGCITAS